MMHYFRNIMITDSDQTVGGGGTRVGGGYGGASEFGGGQTSVGGPWTPVQTQRPE